MSGWKYSRDAYFRLGRNVCLVLVLVVLAAGVAAAAPADSADPVRYLNDIKALTAPAMEGRGDGSKGLTRAARLIENRFRSLGLTPAGNRSFEQPFNIITGARLKGDTSVSVSSGSKKEKLKLNQDFIPFNFSSSGQVDAPVVFAGYGITAPEFGYDDYAHLDAKGKVVLLLRYEPAGFAAKSDHAGYTRHAALITKAIDAKDHGALAVILVNGKLPGSEQDLLVRFGHASGPESVGIPFIQVKNAAAERWLAGTGKSLADLQSRIDNSTEPASFALPDDLQISLKVDIEHTRATVDNILAYLPGKTDQYIIIGAHYDHLGRGYYGSLAPSMTGHIFPGADDNASGTAGVLELARLLAPMKGKLQRGILFACFAGEELGLLGSADWVRNPTLPLGNAVAMINMDMIGRIRDNKVFVGGTGTGSTFMGLLQRDQKSSNFKFQYSPGGYSASDHTSFVIKHIPVLFFFSGLHSDYHKPSDTWEKINAPGAAHLLDYIAEVVTQIDDAATRPQFEVVAGEHAPEPSASGGGQGYGPYFGSVPDFGQQVHGVRFSDVLPKSPAAKAGLRAGDVLVEFGSKPIGNLYDFADALRRSKVGDVVQVKVLRDGEPLTVSVTLEQRR